MMNKQKENLEKLFQLIKENPELPIVPMVDSEIVANDYCSWWMGGWGKAEIDKYLITDECVYLHSLDDAEIIEKFVSHDEYMSMSDSECEQAFENLPWTKAIIVNIDLPD